MQSNATPSTGGSPLHQLDQLLHVLPYARSSSAPRGSTQAFNERASTSRGTLITPVDAFRTMLDKLANEHYRQVEKLQLEISNLSLQKGQEGPPPDECVLDEQNHINGLSAEIEHLHKFTPQPGDPAARGVLRCAEELKSPPPDDDVLEEHPLVESVPTGGCARSSQPVCTDDVRLSCSDDLESRQVDQASSLADRVTVIPHQGSKQANFAEDDNSFWRYTVAGSLEECEHQGAQIHELWTLKDTLMHSWSTRFTGIMRITKFQQRPSRSASQYLEDSAKKAAEGFTSLCRLSRPPVLPSSQFKMCWDVSAMLALSYDVVFIPMQAFDLPQGDTSFLGILDWICIFFWTCDLVLNFFTGYYSKDGKVVTSLKKIACRYLKRWFSPDVLIIAVDWLTIFMQLTGKGGGADGAGLARLGKIMRVVRSMRTLRLLRLMKLRQFMGIIFEVIESEWMSLLLGTLFNLFALVGVNHGIACLWFWLGSTTTSGTAWVEKYSFTTAPWWDQYVASLHWSLTQFTAASSQVIATNPGERLFSVIVLLFAICAFSSFLSGITSAMTRLRTINSYNFAQSILLNKFLRQNRISRDLSARVTRYVQLLHCQHEAYLDADKVEYLKLLSGPLNIELQWERFMRVLKPHPFFQKCSHLGQSAMHHLCYTGVSSAFLARQDVLFDWGAECEKMYFPQNGWLFYRRPPGFKKTPRYVVMTRGMWFCENPLWTPWMHHGMMKTLIEVTMVALSVDKFHATVRAHPEVFSIGRKTAHAFVDVMNNPDETRPYTWDVPWEVMYPEQDQYLDWRLPIEIGKATKVNEEVFENFDREAQLVELEYSRHEDEGDAD